jgi:spermidine synthase
MGCNADPMSVEIVARAEEDGRNVVLRRVGQRYDVVIGNVVLLSSGSLGTEHAFGALAGLAPPGVRARVLVGGLGFGATLRGVLAAVGADAEVTVAERLACIESFARGPAAHLVGGALEDPRVRLLRRDVGALIDEAENLTAILLDVDNGPDWASFRENARLYTPAGLAAARRALVHGGVLAVWSGYAADAFVPRLREAGFTPRTEPLREGAVVRARAYVGVVR